MFRSGKYTVLGSWFVQKILATRSSEDILLLNDKLLSEIEGHCQRLEMQQKKLKEAQVKEKRNEKIEHMKQGPAENMTIAVLKHLLEDKGIAFRSKAKKKNETCNPNPKHCYFADKHPQIKNR